MMRMHDKGCDKETRRVTETKGAPFPGSSHIVRPKTVLSLGELVRLRGLKASLLRVGLGHVLALLGIAVIAAAFLVIDAAVGVDPDHALLWRGAGGGPPPGGGRGGGGGGGRG